MNQELNQNVAISLRASCFLLFIGRAGEHLFWDATPFRALLWDESLLSGPLRTLGVPWGEYVGNVAVDRGISIFTMMVGAFYALCALAALRIRPGFGFERRLLQGGATLVGALALLLAKDHGFQLGALIEHAAQVAAPLLLCLALNWSPSSVGKLPVPLKVAISLTFAGHGLYALGFHAVPGKYLDMIIAIFGMNETAARSYLAMAGVVDLVVALALWLPATARPALFYAAGWGTLTSLARISTPIAWGAMDWDSLGYGFIQAILRAPHALLPLSAFYLQRPHGVTEACRGIAIEPPRSECKEDIVAQPSSSLLPS